MLDDFAAALSTADRVIIPNIYFARDKEEDVKALRPEALSEAVSALGTDAVYIGDLPRTADHLIASLTPGDILLLAGAGDVDTLAAPILEGLERRFL